MIAVSEEDYLKSILEAESEGEEVISARLADPLEALRLRWPWPCAASERVAWAETENDRRSQPHPAGRNRP